MYLVDRIKEDGENLDLALECVAIAQGRKVRTNTLTMSSNQLTQMRLDEKLFGSAETVYVSREQMRSLSAEMYAALDIVEEYEMSEYRFNEAFINDFIRQTGEGVFSQVFFFFFIFWIEAVNRGIRL